MNIKKNIYPFLLIAIPLTIIFLAFYNPAYGSLVRRSSVIFVVLAVPYCLFVKDPRMGLLIFLAEASLLEGPWKTFAYGMKLKLLMYIIRDLLLYTTFLNFLINKRKILPEETLKERIPHKTLITLFLLNIFIQLFNPNGDNLLCSIAGSRFFWEMIPLYWMGFYLMRDKKNFIVFFWACIICVFFNSIAAILQYNWGAERVAQITRGYYAIIYEWGREYKEVTLRPPGLGPDMGFAGFLFWQAIPIFISLLFIAAVRKKAHNHIYLVILSALFIVGIAGLIFSMARTAVVLSAMCAIIYMWLIRKTMNRIFHRLILIFLIMWLFIPYIFSKAEIALQRYETIKNPKELAKTVFETERGRYVQAFVYPIYQARVYFFGNGMGRAGPGIDFFATLPPADTNSENTINMAITELGTIGVFLLLLFHVRIIADGFKILKGIKDVQWQSYTAVPLTCMMVLLTQWQFGHLINFPNNASFWFVSGILMASKNIKYD